MRSGEHRIILDAHGEIHNQKLDQRGETHRLVRGGNIRMVFRITVDRTIISTLKVSHIGSIQIGGTIWVLHPLKRIIRVKSLFQIPNVRHLIERNLHLEEKYRRNWLNPPMVVNLLLTVTFKKMLQWTEI